MVEDKTKYPWMNIPGHEPFNILALETALNLPPATVVALGYLVRDGERNGGGASRIDDYTKTLIVIFEGLKIECEKRQCELPVHLVYNGTPEYLVPVMEEDHGHPF